MHGRVRRLGHALDGLRHLPRGEVVNHVSRPPYDLQHAAPDLDRNVRVGAWTPALTSAGRTPRRQRLRRPP